MQEANSKDGELGLTNWWFNLTTSGAARTSSAPLAWSQLRFAFAQEMPVVMDVFVNTYTHIKESNPLLKQSLQMGEEVSIWTRQRSMTILKYVGLDGVVDNLDKAMAQGVHRVGDLVHRVLARMQEQREQLHYRIADVRAETHRRVEARQLEALKRLDALLDVVEQKCQPLMLADSKKKEEESVILSLSNIGHRAIDITYRLHIGTVHLAVDKTRQIVQPEQLALTLNKVLNPLAVGRRARIILIESVSRPEEANKINHEDDLIALDKWVISFNQGYSAKAYRTVDDVKERGNLAKEHLGQLVDRLRNVRALSDLRQIVLDESISAVDLVQASSQPLGKSTLLLQLRNTLASAAVGEGNKVADKQD